jgi:hypothetical protein
MARTSHSQRLTGSHSLRRRQLLSIALSGTVGTFAAAALGACSQEPDAELRLTQEGESPSVQPSTTLTNTTAPKVLVAYFSRTGENYANGGRTWLRSATPTSSPQ